MHTVKVCTYAMTAAVQAMGTCHNYFLTTGHMLLLQYCIAMTHLAFKK